MIVAINNNKVPIIPELFLNNFLPNIPSNKKPANGSNGMSAMYMAFGMLLFIVSGRDQKFYGQTETVGPGLLNILILLLSPHQSTDDSCIN